MKRILGLILVISIVAACRDKEQRLKYTIGLEFPQEQHVAGQIMNTLDHFGIRSLMVIDSFLVVVTPKDSNYFHVYSTVNEELISKFSGKGRGPEEFISVDPILSVGDNPKQLFHLYDFGRKEITKIDFITSIKEGEFTYENFPTGVANQGVKSPVETVYHVSEDRIIYRDAFEKAVRFSILNYDTGETVNIPHNFPKRTEYRISESSENRVFMATTLAVKQSLNKIALGPYLLGELDFFDLDGKYLSTTLYVSQETNRKHLSDLYDNPGALHSFNKIVSSDNSFIYILNNNYLEGVIPPSAGENNYKPIPSPESVGHTNELLVFDWEGKPAMKILFDKFISNCTVDSENRLIYGIYRQPLGDDVVIKYRF